MKYKKIKYATFLERPNRFIAKVLIDGKEEIAHVKNTGRCKELLISGAKVILEDCSDHPSRKTKYSLISVWKKDLLINMDSQAPNTVVYQALKENKIIDINNLSLVKREVSFGKSRFDLYFESHNTKGFIEVKGVTLENNNISMFPDAPTERGTKHILEMIEATKQGYRGIIFFLIQMKGPNKFMPNYKMDKNFSYALTLAKESGVEIWAYDSIITDDEIVLGNPIEIDLNSP